MRLALLSYHATHESASNKRNKQPDKPSKRRRTEDGDTPREADRDPPARSVTPDLPDPNNGEDEEDEIEIAQLAEEELLQQVPGLTIIGCRRNWLLLQDGRKFSEYEYLRQMNMARISLSSATAASEARRAASELAALPQIPSVISKRVPRVDSGSVPTRQQRPRRSKKVLS